MHRCYAFPFALAGFFVHLSLYISHNCLFLYLSYVLYKSFTISVSVILFPFKTFFVYVLDLTVSMPVSFLV